MMMSGTILIEKDAPRPHCFQVDENSFPSAWMSVRSDLTPRELEKELAAEGWTFFYIAGAIRMTAFGFDHAKMMGAALKRVVADVRRQRCNCFEIDQVAAYSLLGVPYLSISAHPRHIQKGLVFAGE